MNTGEPLTNPIPEDFDTSDSQIPQEENINSKEQLEMELYSPSGKIQKWVAISKMNLKKRNELLEISMLWKSPALPFAITSLILNLLMLIVGGIIKFNELPPKIPLFYNSADKKWEQTDKSIIFIFPIFLFISEAIILNFVVKIFRYDRRLSMVSCWILTFLNILIFITISEFYSLLT